MHHDYPVIGGETYTFIVYAISGNTVGPPSNPVTGNFYTIIIILMMSLLIIIRF